MGTRLVAAQVPYDRDISVTVDCLSNVRQLLILVDMITGSIRRVYSFVSALNWGRGWLVQLRGVGNGQAGLALTTDEIKVMSQYNTRIQKGGALIDDMRKLIRAWQATPAEQQEQAVVRMNVLNKKTRARSADILRRTYIPRFVEGPIPNAWKLVRPLEDVEASPQFVKPIYYWISAKAEPMISDFVREFLLPRLTAARAGIEQPEVLDWFFAKGCRWSPTVSIKVTRGLLAALRDFGVLEGRATKRLASMRLSIGSFAYLAFCLHQLGSLGRDLVFHPDWQLFLLQTGDVEHYLLEAHQRRILEYHAAGSTVRLSFPYDSLEEYARVVVNQSN